MRSSAQEEPIAWQVSKISQNAHALEDAQRRLCTGGGADLGGERSIAQYARRLIVVARGRGHIDAQQDLPPPVQHVPEQMRHLWHRESIAITLCSIVGPS